MQGSASPEPAADAGFAIDRTPMPEPLTGVRAVRREQQRWHRINRAAGELEIGYDAQGRPVRVEYHWIRWFSRANPAVDDVYTAELWVRQPSGDWLYLQRPSQVGFVAASHAAVRGLLARHLNIDAGE